MRCIIAGSRSITQYWRVEDAIQQSGWMDQIKLVISGGARGVDQMGQQWAVDCGIPVQVFTPDWDGKGKQAGFLRNAEMAEQADALIALWDGKSNGTRHMIETAKRRGLKVFVVTVDGAPEA